METSELGKNVGRLGDLPVAEWKEIHRSTAQQLVEAGRPVLVCYLADWKVPSGASGVDEGWMFVHGNDIRTTRTWEVRADPEVRAIFGGDSGSYSFYCDANEPVPNLDERLAELQAEEDARWAELQAQGYVRVRAKSHPSGWREIEVDGEIWPSVYKAEDAGFPQGDCAGFSDPVEIHRDELVRWYGAAITAHPEMYDSRDLDAVVIAANAAVRGRGSIADLRRTLREADRYQ